MHKFSTTSTKSSALTARPASGYPLVSLLKVPHSTFAGADPQTRVPLARLVRSSLSSLRDKNLFIIRAKLFLFLCVLASCAAPQTPPTLGEIASGQVEVVDLGYALNEQNPYWPGEGYSPFHFEILATLEADGVYSGAFSTAEHLGTHLDAPNHFEAGQPSVDQIKLEDLIAPLVVVDIREACRSNPDYRLSREDLDNWEKQNGPIPSGSVVFGLTGWGQHWDDYERYKNQDASGQLHFPGFSEAAAAFLVEEREIRGIGIDTLSVDYGLSADFSIHHIVNGAAAYHIENAANLDKVPLSGAWVMIAPIKIEKGSGGPARVWAVFR